MEVRVSGRVWVGFGVLLVKFVFWVRKGRLRGWEIASIFRGVDVSIVRFRIRVFGFLGFSRFYLGNRLVFRIYGLFFFILNIFRLVLVEFGRN